jgi:dTDP-4-dehydrorhamnose reductase
LINHKAVGILLKWARYNGARLIHLSTDYVFAGNSRLPLNEEAKTAPINVYGETKLAGELICFHENQDTIVIRTVWVYSFFGSNFVKTMMRLMKNNKQINVVNDQFGSPTYAADLAQVILTIVASPDWKPEIYHYSNSGTISWFEFACDIKEIGRYSTHIVGIPSSEFPTPAKRPSFSVLDKGKIQNDYNVDVPYYKDSLKKCIALLKQIDVKGSL